MKPFSLNPGDRWHKTVREKFNHRASKSQSHNVLRSFICLLTEVCKNSWTSFRQLLVGEYLLEPSEQAVILTCHKHSTLRITIQASGVGQLKMRSRFVIHILTWDNTISYSVT